MMSCTETCNTNKVISFAVKGLSNVLKESLDRGEGCLRCANKNKDTLLLLAAKNGNVNVMKVLLEYFPDGYIEHFNKTGKRALHEAIQYNRYEVVQFLIEYGADVNALKQGDWTGVMIAAEKKYVNIVQLLVEHNADITLYNKDGWNAFHIAARAGSVDVLQFIYSLHPDSLNTISKNGRSPLHSSAMNNSVEVTRWLLDAGLPPDLEDSCGITPLMDAARMGHITVCSILLEYKADILKLDSVGRTILHHVTQAGQLDMVTWCVEQAELKLSKKGKFRKIIKKHQARNKISSLKYQADQGLINASNFINWRSQQGGTALHYAAKEAKYLEIRTLLKLGSDRTIKDNFGRLAVEMTDNETVRVLLS